MTLQLMVSAFVLSSFAPEPLHHPSQRPLHPLPVVRIVLHASTRKLLKDNVHHQEELQEVHCLFSTILPYITLLKICIHYLPTFHLSFRS